MNVNVSGAFVYFTIPILGGIPITQTTVSSFLVAVILMIVGIWIGKDLKKRPSGKQVLAENGYRVYTGKQPVSSQKLVSHFFFWRNRRKRKS